MKVGALVIRKIPPEGWKNQPAQEQRSKLGAGFIISKQISGDPPHPCITVIYPKVGKAYAIAESLMEVVSEGG